MLPFILVPTHSNCPILKATKKILGNVSTSELCFGYFPGCPVVETSPSNAGGAGLIPFQGAKIPHASGPKKPKHKTEAIL